jgi:hypothetical protein
MESEQAVRGDFVSRTASTATFLLGGQLRTSLKTVFGKRGMNRALPIYCFNWPSNVGGADMKFSVLLPVAIADLWLRGLGRQFNL